MKFRHLFRELEKQVQNLRNFSKVDILKDSISNIVGSRGRYIGVRLVCDVLLIDTTPSYLYCFLRYIEMVRYTSFKLIDSYNSSCGLKVVRNN
jgi:hypothetical protein